MRRREQIKDFNWRVLRYELKTNVFFDLNPNILQKVLDLTSGVIYLSLWSGLGVIVCNDLQGGFEWD